MFSQRKQSRAAEPSEQRGEAMYGMHSRDKQELAMQRLSRGGGGCLRLILWFYLAMSQLVLVFRRSFLHLCGDWATAE